MTYLILSCLVIATLCSRKKKKVVTVCWLFFCTILMGLNNTIADRENYFLLYDRISKGNFSAETVEIGFRYLIKVSSLLHINKEWFYLGISFVTLCLLIQVIQRYVSGVNYVVLLYVIFSFCIDAAQLRFMLAMAIILYSLKFLEDNNKKNFIKFIVMVILATSIHNSMLFFIFLLIHFFVHNKKRLILYNILGIMVAVSLVRNNLFWDLISRFVFFEGDMRWFSDRNFSLVGKYYNAWLIIFILLFFYLYYGTHDVNDKYLGLIKTDTVKNHIAEQYWKIAYTANTVSIWTIFFTLFSGQFRRLERVFIIVNYISFVLFLESNKRHLKIKISKGIYLIFAIIAIIPILVIECYTVMDTTYLQIFESNLLLPGFFQ